MHRRPQFVRHVGEKFRLGFARLLSRFLGGIEIGCPFDNQFLQFVSVTQQLGFGGFARGNVRVDGHKTAIRQRSAADLDGATIRPRSLEQVRRRAACFFDDGHGQILGVAWPIITSSCVEQCDFIKRRRAGGKQLVGEFEDFLEFLVGCDEMQFIVDQRNAAGNMFNDRLHARPVPFQLSERLFPFRNIGGDPEIARYRSIVTVNGGDHQIHRESGSIFAHVRPLATLRAKGLRLCDEHFETLNRVTEFCGQEATAFLDLPGNMQYCRRIEADHLLCVVAQHLFSTAVKQPDHAVDVSGNNGDLCSRIQYCLALAVGGNSLPLRQAEFGDVGQGANQDRMSVGVGGRGFSGNDGA